MAMHAKSDRVVFFMVVNGRNKREFFPYFLILINHRGYIWSPINIPSKIDNVLKRSR